MSLELNQKKDILKQYIADNFFKNSFIIDLKNALGNCVEQDVRFDFLDLLNAELTQQYKISETVSKESAKNNDNDTWSQAISIVNYCDYVWTEIIYDQKDYFEKSELAKN